MFTPEEQKVAQRFANKIWKQALLKTKAVIPAEQHGVIAGCFLRDGAGNRCFIGACIPNSRYKLELEQVSDNFNAPSMKKALGLNNIPSVLSAFLCEAQYVHDEYETGRWESRLAVLYEKYGLSVPKQLAKV